MKFDLSVLHSSTCCDKSLLFNFVLSEHFGFKEGVVGTFVFFEQQDPPKNLNGFLPPFVFCFLPSP
jgi:hypothetical protein